MAKMQTKRKATKSMKNRKSKNCSSKRAQKGAGLFWSSEDEKLYNELKKQLTGDEYKKFTQYKEHVKTNIKNLIDAASKIDYKEMLKAKISTHIVQKIGNCRGATSRTPIEQCLQSIIPANINLNDVLNKQIDIMLGSTQPQSRYGYGLS